MNPASEMNEYRSKLPRGDVVPNNPDKVFSDYCFRCNKDMRHSAYYGDFSSPLYGEQQNELTMLFVGGYGSFIDTAFDGCPTLTICHECAHELCEFLRIDPHNWHTHSQVVPAESHPGQHPDHHDRSQEG